MKPRIRLTDVMPPRGLTDAETAYYLGISLSHFMKVVAIWERDHNFPPKDALLDRRDFEALQAWYDQRSNFVRNPTPATIAVQTAAPSPWDRITA